MKITWQIIVDIVICTLILHYVMRWLFANRQVARLVLKLLVLSGFALVVNQLNLPMSQILTAYVALPVAFLLVLMFIPEIKRAYQLTTLERLLSFSSSASNEFVQTLAHALLELSQKRCGALLVFPKSDDIKALIYGGEEYDAKVTKSLLLSIFNPGCPRHDGAVVVQDGKITQVGAFLPLSTSEELDDDWGTRHLAALGLSEKSDAQVIIVSEERGTISIAKEGKIKIIRRTTPESLANALSSHLETGILKDTEKKKKISVAVGLWVLAFVTSVLGVGTLHWFQKENSSPEHYRFIVAQAPISFNNIPDKFYLAETSTLNCQVYLKFPAIAEPLPPDFGISIDLKDYPSDVSTITLTEDMLNNIPPKWEAVRYTPQEIKILLAEAKNVELEIEPRTTGLAKNLKISSTNVIPSSLKVRVEDKRLKKNKKLETAFINLEHITQAGEYTFQTSLELPATIRPLNKGIDKNIAVTLKIIEKK